MKCIILLAMLSLPAWAEVDSLFVDSAGVVSLNWTNRNQPLQSLALEGRNAEDQSWRPLEVWNLPPHERAASKFHLESRPGSACREYRVLSFDSSHFLSEQRITPPPPPSPEATLVGANETPPASGTLNSQ